MGFNIFISTLDYKDHPQWDSLRYVGDRDVPKILSAIERDEIPQTEALMSGYVPLFERPKDFAAARALTWPEENPERWKLLLDILEADPEYWISYSY